MSRDVHVAGTRTFSAEAIDLATSSGFTVLGLLEPSDRATVGTRIHDHGVAWLDDGPTGGCDRAVVGTGDSSRRSVVERLGRAGWRPVTIVHPAAHVAPTATLGDGTLVGAGVVIGARAEIGDHVVLNRGVLVGHHTRIDELATVGPGANVAGNVGVGSEAFIGMGAAVRDHVTVGAGAVVAMGSVVVRDVAAGERVRGVPAAVYG